MPKRINKSTKKKQSRLNRPNFLAPPKGFAYPGNPIHLSDTARLKILAIEIAKTATDIAPMERDGFIERIKNNDRAELKRLFESSGFSFVKRKELKTYVQPSKVQSSTRSNSGETSEEGGVTGADEQKKLKFTQLAR